MLLLESTQVLSYRGPSSHIRVDSLLVDQVDNLHVERQIGLIVLRVAGITDVALQRRQRSRLPSHALSHPGIICHSHRGGLHVVLFHEDRWRRLV